MTEQTQTTETTPGALEGLKVLDITQVMAGSYCGMLLADLGADVIKVERPKIGDLTRWAGDGVDAFAPLNRNKRSIAVDYRSEQGQEVLCRLADDADVIVENHRPGTLEKYGLGAKDMLARNPRLVYCSISGFGAVGPRSSQSGFDLMAQGMSGIMSTTGEVGGDPCKAGVPIADLNAGVFATIGITSALVSRGITGKGQVVTTSLLESSIAYLVWESMLWFQADVVAEPGGSAHRLVAPYEAFRTEDGWITIAAPSPAAWMSLCEVLQRPDFLEEPAFAKSLDRLKNRAQLAEAITEITRTKPSEYWNSVLKAANIASGPVYQLDEVWDDPQVQATEMVIGEGRDRRVGNPIKLSDTPMTVRKPSPGLGEHTAEVLAESGWSNEEIAELFASGAVDGASGDGELSADV